MNKGLPLFRYCKWLQATLANSRDSRDFERDMFEDRIPPFHPLGISTVSQWLTGSAQCPDHWTIHEIWQAQVLRGLVCTMITILVLRFYVQLMNRQVIFVQLQVQMGSGIPISTYPMETGASRASIRLGRSQRVCTTFSGTFSWGQLVISHRTIGF